MRLLVVEDEPDLARTLRKALAEEEFAVDVVGNGEDAIFHATEVAYDAIILDLMLPGTDGWTALETLRRGRNRTPVVVLTARDTLADKVRGLNLGADDYLTKPFAVTELVARIRAVIRRASTDPAPTLTVGDVTIDTAAREVRRTGRIIALTSREYAILEFLVRRRGTLVTRTTIREHLYAEDDDVFSNVVDVHVAGLRRKLGQGVIETRRGHGYIIEA
jgi:two-component system, OmpR family, response regulator